MPASLRSTGIDTHAAGGVLGSDEVEDRWCYVEELRTGELLEPIFKKKERCSPVRAGWRAVHTLAALRDELLVASPHRSFGIHEAQQVMIVRQS